MARYPYDKTIKVGDLIKSYHKGIHRVTLIENFKHGACYTYEQVLTAHWTPTKKKLVNTSHSTWCCKVTPESIQMEMDEMIKHFREAAELLFGPGVVAQWESNILAE
jgi:hypothetical protein